MSNQPPHPEEYEEPPEPDPAEIIEDAGYDSLGHLWPYNKCSCSSCLWKDNETSLGKFKVRISDGFPEYENNEIRKKMYCDAAFTIHGMVDSNPTSTTKNGWTWTQMKRPT
jgi:hypothetical protein